VTVGNDCLIENVGSYISNYHIGDQCYIRNIGSMMVTGRNAFGNGVTVAALNESGSCAFPICEGLSSQTAYVMAMFDHRPELVAGLKQLVEAEVERHISSYGQVGDGAIICDTRQIVNVCIGAGCMVNGASKLVNGTLLNEGGCESTVGSDVIAQDFILSGGAQLDNGVILSRCFVGQGSHLNNRFTATDCYIASNCHFENGEACSMFAGPYTVSHHKSTLLIAGLYSFMNAGSGTNQSNHLYKTGPVHQGLMHRGCKTGSGCYIMWPATIGAYTLVKGSVNKHPDTTCFPFSYLIGEGHKNRLIPGQNLFAVGTWRDWLKWPLRDKRVKGAEHDLIRFDLLTPFVLHHAIWARRTLQEIAECPYVKDEITILEMNIPYNNIHWGYGNYRDMLKLGFAQAFTNYLQRRTFSSEREFQQFVRPKTDDGDCVWTDLSGLIAPETVLERLWNAVEEHQLEDLAELQQQFQEIDNHYDEYVWSWAYPRLPEAMGWTETPDGNYTVENYLQLAREGAIAMDVIHHVVESDTLRELQQIGFDFGVGNENLDRYPFLVAMNRVLKEVQTAAEDVKECLGNLTTE
jgi:NDP-sugar pyrophosphorylase family protein